MPPDQQGKDLPSAFEVISAEMKRLRKHSSGADKQQAKKRIDNAKRELASYQEAMHRVFMELLKNQLLDQLEATQEG